MQPRQSPYSYEHPAISVGVRDYNPRVDGIWAIECNRLSRKLQTDLGMDAAPGGFTPAAATVRGILAEFTSPDIQPTHTFEARCDDQPFAAIAVRLAVLPEPESAAVVICGFVGNQLANLPKPQPGCLTAEIARIYQSSLFLAFLAGWANRRGYSGKLKMAVGLLSKNSSMVKVK